MCWWPVAAVALGSGSQFFWACWRIDAHSVHVGIVVRSGEDISYETQVQVSGERGSGDHGESCMVTGQWNWTSNGDGGGYYFPLASMFREYPRVEGKFSSPLSKHNLEHRHRRGGNGPA